MTQGKTQSLLERAQFAVSKSNEHEDHWTEPRSLTQGRPTLEHFCESCGVEIPWHLMTCSFMRRVAQTKTPPIKE